MTVLDAGERLWLVLTHQIPPEPPGFRMRVWRRLQAIGALQLKSSVYLLPDRDDTREDFEWLAREIEDGGAEATLLRSTILAGTSDEECVERFREASEAEYGALRAELQELARKRRARRSKSPTGEDDGRAIAKLREALALIVRRDFFAADGRETVEALLAELAGEEGEMSPEPNDAIAKLRGKTWTTRAGVYVDRMASAWLVLRHVDPTAQFRFVAAKSIEPRNGEIRFDTFGGEFTHEGERCTFEVIARRLRLDSPGLRKLGEIVHDLDLKDERHGHPETAGVAAALDGIVATTPDDDQRIARAAVLFDGLVAGLARSA